MNVSAMSRIETLNKDNYDTWKMQMQAILVKNNAWKYVSGTDVKTELVADDDGISAQARAQWDDNDKKAMSDLILSIHPSELKQIKGCTSSREIWLKLEGIYQSKGPARKATLLKRLALQKMADGEDVREHIRTFFDAVDKLTEMEVIINPDLLAILLLYSLPSPYENFRCAIESRDELPAPEALRIKIIEESDARKKDNVLVQNAMAIKPYANKNWKNKKKATSKNEGKEKSKIKCHSCGKIGHKATDCWHRDKQLAKTAEDIGFFTTLATKSLPPETHEARRRLAKITEGEVSRTIAEDGECRSQRAGPLGGSVRSFPKYAEGATIANRSENNKSTHALTATRNDLWCLDSGCTSHICKNAHEFTEMKACEVRQLNLASNVSTKINAKGVVTIVTNSDGRETNVVLSDTLHVPDLRTNLLSVGKITEKGFSVTFNRNSASIIDDDGNTKLVAKRIDGLYYLEGNPRPECKLTSNRKIQTGISTDSEIVKWHRRLGHLNLKDLVNCDRENRVRGLRLDKFHGPLECEICTRAKMTRLPFPKNSNRKTELLELIYSDVCGPMRAETNGGARYFVTFIDDNSKWCHVRIIKRKSDVFNCFVEFKAFAENSTGKKIKYLQTDNGLEYVNTEFDEFLKVNGIQRRLTVPYNPEQNGTAERKNRTLVEMARCLLTQSGLATSFWGEAIATANYLRNRCPTSSLKGKTPYEKWRGRTPNVSHLRDFGCEVYVLDRTPGKGKLEPRSTKGTFIGYSDTSRAYRVWLSEEKKVVTSRDVKFMENNAQNSTRIESVPETFNEEQADDPIDGPHEIDIELTPPPIVNETAPEDETQENFEDRQSAMNERDDVAQRDSQARRGRGRPTIVRTGLRGRPPKRYHEARTASEEMEHAFSAEIPIRQAMDCSDADEWIRAMAEEVISIVKNDTWELEQRPTNRDVIGSRFVLRNKYDANGVVERRKARLVAKGFSQKPGVDFHETFAPVARLSSIRALTAVAAKHQMSMHQIDVTTAYLNGNLDEEIFMELPEFLEETMQRVVQSGMASRRIKDKVKKMLDQIRTGDMVCRLRKSLYGLRQAARSWNNKISEAIKEYGGIPADADPCIFRVNRGGITLLVAVYVDDIIIASDSIKEIRNLKQFLAQKFDIKDQGEIGYCIGLEFNRDNGGISIRQKGYTLDILKRFGMADSKSVSTPMDIGVKLTHPEGAMEKKYTELPYRELVGALMYLATGTRPDIAHAVSFLSQFLTNYSQEHWTAAKRVLRYLRGTPDIGITYGCGGSSIIGFSDSDWGNCLTDRRSYTGYIFMYNRGAVSWESRKQRTVALSSTEAEYMALTEASKEAIHLKGLLKFLNSEDTPEVIVFSDNQGALKLAENPVFHARTKHIDIRHHFVREAVNYGFFQLGHISTEEMAADVLTKSLPRSKHDKCRSLIGLGEA